jgi:hypothetical protein
MTVSRWTGVEVRALRIAALRDTQQEFADRAGFFLPTIKKWHGATWEKPVRGASAEALDTMLRGLDDEQRERFDAELATRSDSSPPREKTSVQPGAIAFGMYAWEVDSDVKRREFGKLAGAVAMTTAVWPFGEHIGPADAQRLLAAVDELEAQDQQIGGGTLVRFALEQLAHAKHTLDTATYDTATGNAFASATGHLAVLAGWLAYDADLHPVARRCYADAMALASEAGDEDLIAHTCLYAANQSIFLTRQGEGRPHHALKLIDRARTLMRGRPPGRIHALIAVREAQAQGVLGDRTGYGRAIATAWREVDQALDFEPEDECPQWLRFVTHSEIRGHEARGWGDIGDLRKSIDLLDAAATEERGTRNALNARAWSAAAHARIGDIPAAVDVGMMVLTELQKVTSGRTLRVLEPVTATDHPAAAEFREAFTALEGVTRKEIE